MGPQQTMENTIEANLQEVYVNCVELFLSGFPLRIKCVASVQVEVSLLVLLCCK
jgi:hypothetical protein